jgi:tyrosine-protein kinase Etk/Wzc
MVFTQSGGATARLASEPGFDESEGIDYWAVLVVLARSRRRILLVTLIWLALGILLAFLMRPTFIASAVILPPRQDSSSASTLIGQLGSLAGLGAGSGLGLKSPDDMYIGMLQSRGIADNLISRFQLGRVFKTKTLVDTRHALLQHVTIESGKDTLIHISVKDRDPQFASDLANGYVDELYKLNSRLTISEAAQRREFFDEQLQQEQTALADAEDAMRSTQQKTGLIELSGQAQTIIRSIADTRAEISARQVELQSLLTSSTDQNSDVIRVKSEIAALESHVAELEDSQKKLQPGNIQVPAERVPEAELEYERKLREVKYHETLFDLLSKEFEAARIDEAKSAPIIQVVDRAIPPDKKSGPPRKLIAAGFAFAGFLGSCLWALWKDKLRRMQQVPEQAERLRLLNQALHSKK